jgi:hypothetical protein
LWEEEEEGGTGELGSEVWGPITKWVEEKRWAVGELASCCLLLEEFGPLLDLEGRERRKRQKKETEKKRKKEGEKKKIEREEREEREEIEEKRERERERRIGEIVKTVGRQEKKRFQRKEERSRKARLSQLVDTSSPSPRRQSPPSMPSRV